MAPCALDRERENIDGCTVIVEDVRDCIHRRSGTVQIVENKDSLSTSCGGVYFVKARQEAESLVKVGNILQLRRFSDSLHAVDYRNTEASAERFGKNDYRLKSSFARGRDGHDDVPFGCQDFTNFSRLSVISGTTVSSRLNLSWYKSSPTSDRFVSNCM